MYHYRLILYPLFGVLPSLVWLAYYLKKDLHPEPKRMIVKVFLLGSLITIPVFFIQIVFSEILQELTTLPLFVNFPGLVSIIKWFVIIAFTEELLKYLVVRIVVFKSYELDEPIDIMMYIITAALGFAALENILYLISPIDNAPFDVVIATTISISFIRFIGATFLHTLSSALLGFFLILSFFHIKTRKILTVCGLLAATFLHGLYNFSIITLDYPFNVLVPIIILMTLAIFIMGELKRVKRLKNICYLLSVDWRYLL